MTDAKARLGVSSQGGPSTPATSQMMLLISPHWPFSIQLIDR